MLPCETLMSENKRLAIHYKVVQQHILDSVWRHVTLYALANCRALAFDRHVGDLGNIKADKKGKVFYKFNDKKVSLQGTNNVIGRAVVVRLPI